jgi:MFS family permease
MRHLARCGRAFHQAIYWVGSSLLVLAKEPLHLGPDQVRALAVWPTLVVVLGGFAAAAMSDRISRPAVMQTGVIVSTLCTLLILVAQDSRNC